MWYPFRIYFFWDQGLYPDSARHDDFGRSMRLTQYEVGPRVIVLFYKERNDNIRASRTT